MEFSVVLTARFVACLGLLVMAGSVEKDSNKKYSFLSPVPTRTGDDPVVFGPSIIEDDRVSRAYDTEDDEEKFELEKIKFLKEREQYGLSDDKFWEPFINVKIDKEATGDLLISRTDTNVSSRIASMRLHRCCNIFEEVIENIPEHPDEIVEPPCLLVKRCRGFCRDRSLTCSPERTNIEIAKYVRYSFLVNQSLKLEETEEVTLEHHEDCKCRCNKKEEDCSPATYFDPRSCRCRCRNQSAHSRCVPTDMYKWNPQTCTCSCRNEDEYCSNGYVFDEKICKCIKWRPS